MSSLTAFTADLIFTGDQWLSDSVLLTDGEIITDVIPVNALESNVSLINLKGTYLVPAFIDLQIYGAYGKLLAVYPEADSLFKLHEYCTKGGAAFCLPTVATNTYDVFFRSIDAIKDYWNKGGNGVLGLHIEGPWINPVKRGAHIESLIHSPSPQQVRELLDYGKGVIKMITLAPEVCSREVIDLILSYDIIISAGHSNATYGEALAGFNAGINTVTHLYNAMSPLQHRSPGLVGATMDSSVCASIIPDGHHVDYSAIRIAKKVMGERLFVITDSVTETDKGYYPHELAGDKYESSGILSGSALTMARAFFNLVKYADVEKEDALRMCSLYPSRVIGQENKIGRIVKGARFAVTAIDEKAEGAIVVDKDQYS